MERHGWDIQVLLEEPKREQAIAFGYLRFKWKRRRAITTAPPITNQ